MDDIKFVAYKTISETLQMTEIYHFNLSVIVSEVGTKLKTSLFNCFLDPNFRIRNIDDLDSYSEIRSASNFETNIDCSMSRTMDSDPDSNTHIRNARPQLRQHLSLLLQFQLQLRN